MGHLLRTEAFVILSLVMSRSDLVQLVFNIRREVVPCAALMVGVGGEFSGEHFDALWTHLILSNDHAGQLNLDHLD